MNKWLLTKLVAQPINADFIYYLSHSTNRFKHHASLAVRLIFLKTLELSLSEADDPEALFWGSLFLEKDT